LSIKANLCVEDDPKGSSLLFEQAFKLILSSKNERQDWNACQCLERISRSYLQRHQHLGEYFSKVQGTCVGKYVKSDSLLKVFMYSIIGECLELHFSPSLWLKKNVFNRISANRRPRSDGMNYVPTCSAEDSLLCLKLCHDLMPSQIKKLSHEDEEIVSFFTKQAHATDQLYFQALMKHNMHRQAYEAICHQVSGGTQIDRDKWYKVALTAFAAEEYEKCVGACRQSVQKEMSLQKVSPFRNSDGVYDTQLQLQASTLGVKAALKIKDTNTAMEFGTAAVSLAAKLSADYSPSSYPQCFHVSGMSTAFLVYGVACAKRAHELTSSSHRLKLLQAGLKALSKAQQQEYCPQMQLILYNLAAIRADLRDITGAIKTIKASLSLDRSHAPSWHLLSLLLSADLKYTKAYQTTDFALKQIPLQKAFGNLPEEDYETKLVYLQIALQWRIRNFTSAASMYKDLAQKVCPELGLKFTSRVLALEEGKKNAATVHVFVPDKERQQPGYRRDSQIDFLLFIMKLYITEGECLAEDVLDLGDLVIALVKNRDDDYAIKHVIPTVHCLFGKCHQYLGQLELALSHAVTAEVHNPWHLDSLCLLGSLNYKLNNIYESEGYFRKCIQIDNSCFEAWNGLGNVQIRLEKFEKAADSYLNSLELQSISPLLPFDTVPRYV